MPNTDVKRKSIPKAVRVKVYEKYDGHCAYCGCELEYKDMQVDHLVPLYWHGGEDDLSNYMPACRSCNFYKSTMTLEKFREQLNTICERLEKDFTYRMARKYARVVEWDRKIPVVFYFEQVEKGVQGNLNDG